MNENRKNMGQEWVDLDDAPDLTTSEWTKIIDATPVKRGRPVSDDPKISTTIRLDHDILSVLKAGGKGWQTRANSLLRKALSL